MSEGSLFSGTIERRKYFTNGFILFALKYQIDRWIIVSYFKRWWAPWNYIFWPEWIGSPAVWSPEQRGAMTAVLLLAIPFIVLGLALTVRRLRSLRLPLASAAFFFVPYLNIFFFALLSLVPSSEALAELPTAPRAFLSRVVPRSSSGSALFGVIVTAIFGLAMTTLSVSFLESYGWGLFVGTPFMTGLLSAMLYSVHAPRTLKECLAVANASVTVLGTAIVLCAVEGILCALMAAPLAFLLATLGGYLAFHAQSTCRTNMTMTACFALPALLPLAISAEEIFREELAPLPVTSEILVDAPREVVWKNVVEFSDLPPPNELLFRTGIAYPLRARIDGRGVGSIRHCEFSTGPFVEPITVWDEPARLGFDVTEVPSPLEEWSVFAAVHAPHVNGFFRSRRGQFELIEQGPGRTLLRGTTWYEHRIWPQSYWRLISDEIIHRIHLRVLRHVKALSERRDR